MPPLHRQQKSLSKLLMGIDRISIKNNSNEIFRYIWNVVTIEVIMQEGLVFVVCDRNRCAKQACICNHDSLYMILLLTSYCGIYWKFDA